MTITHNGITVELDGRVMRANGAYSSIPWDYRGLENFRTTEDYLRDCMRKFAEWVKTLGI